MRRDPHLSGHHGGLRREEALDDPVDPALGGGHPGFALEITDPVVAANNGIYDLCGNATNRPPQIKLSAGRLIQWLSGYRSLAQLAAQGNALVFDKEAAVRLDRLLPTQNCLCSEEY